MNLFGTFKYIFLVIEEGEASQDQEAARDRDREREKEIPSSGTDR